MSVPLYMDVHIRRAVVQQLRLRNVDVLTAQEDYAAKLPDDQLLDRATALGRMLVTQDDDLLAEAGKRQRDGTRFSGVAYGHQLDITVGRLVHDLELIAMTLTPAEASDQVVYLPL